jgi:hypothetical protein
MNHLRTFGAFWYDFIVGDDWRIAVSVIAALGATAALVHGAHVHAWWLLIVVVIAGLATSLWIATRAERRRY